MILEFKNKADNAKDHDGNEGDWITVNGNHIFIKKGQSKEKAVKEFLKGKLRGKEEKKEKNKEKISIFKYMQHYKASPREIARETGLDLRDTFKKLKEMVEAGELEYDPRQDLYYRPRKKE